MHPFLRIPCLAIFIAGFLSWRSDEMIFARAYKILRFWVVRVKSKKINSMSLENLLRGLLRSHNNFLWCHSTRCMLNIISRSFSVSRVRTPHDYASKLFKGALKAHAAIPISTHCTVDYLASLLSNAMGRNLIIIMTQSTLCIENVPNHFLKPLTTASSSTWAGLQLRATCSPLRTEGSIWLKCIIARRDIENN